MSKNIIHLNPEAIHTELKDLVKNSIEETLNAMLDAEADRLVNAERYARNEERQGYRAGHYERKFGTSSGEVKMLKAIHAQEDRKAALEKAKAVEEKLRGMKLNKAADKVRDGISETLTYMQFPEEHWMRIRTNNTLERVNREIKRRTKVVGTFPDGQSALMLVCARLRHVSSSEWGSKRYLNMDHLRSMISVEDGDIITG